MMPALDLAISPATHQRGFWKEERVEGAIYSVSLKKIRYHSNFAASSESETPISQLQWHTMRVRTIKAGSLEKLVENLAPEKESLEELDPGYLIAFLSTYRTFAKTTEVIDLLFDRYRSFLCNDFGEKAEVVEGVLRGVVTVFTVWMEQFPGDFDESPNYTCLNKMLNFVTSEMKACHGDELSRKIQHRLDKFQITPFEDQDLDFLTFNLPVASNLNHASETDISPVTEEFANGSADMLSMEPFRCAEQLTAMDAKLFKKVIAWHCLGCIWGKNKKEGRASSVKATVDQFNAVSLRVTSSILASSRSKSSGANMRGKLISWWISVAQECRDLKNFSSLKAILSGLQSAPIHRLKKSWSNVSKDNQSLFQELSNIFSEDSNQQSSRELLMKEGTAKWAQFEPTSPTKKLTTLKKRRSRCIELGIIQGTVPYLGTFLTDLMMLHTALPDLTEDGLINFEKRRKEFEIIAQIKLFQGAAKNYAIAHDDEFRLWFDNIKTFSEGESYRLSCEVEKFELKLPKKRGPRLRRMRSESDISKLSFCQDLSQALASPVPDKPCKSNENSPVTPRRHQRNNSASSSSSTSSGVSSGSERCLATAITKPSSYSLPRPRYLPALPSPSPRTGKTVFSRRSLPATPDSPSRSVHAGCIIRVSIEGMEDRRSGGVVYRGIWLADDERTPSVIRTCLEKREMKADPCEYTLVQVLTSGSELVIPDNANVYYALNSSMEPLLFKLKKKATGKSS